MTSEFSLELTHCPTIRSLRSCRRTRRYRGRRGAHVAARSERLQSLEGLDENVCFGAKRLELVDEALPDLVLRVRDALADPSAGLFELLPVLRQIIHQMIDDIGSLNTRCQGELLLDRGDFGVHRADPLVLENLQGTDPAFPALNTEKDQSGDPGDKAGGREERAGRGQ